jgi:hypothetical protein
VAERDWSTDWFAQQLRALPNFGPVRAAPNPSDDRRRAAIEALIVGGATEGERSAAQAAMERLDAAADAHAGRMGRLDSEASGFGAYD